MSLDLIPAALTSAALLFLLLPLKRLTTRQRALTLLALLAVSAMPVDGATLATFVRGILGDLAVTTMVFLAWAALGKVLQWSPRPLSERVGPAGFYAALGLAMYPAMLGLCPMEPYRLGFEPTWLLVVCGIATVGFSVRGYGVTAIAMILATLAFTLDLGHSRNYWDYILDPVLAIYSVLVVLRWMASTLRSRSGLRHSGTPSQLLTEPGRAG